MKSSPPTATLRGHAMTKEAPLNQDRIDEEPRLRQLVLAVLAQQSGAEASLRDFVQPLRCGGGPDPEQLCDLALAIVAEHGAVADLSDWAFSILGKQLGVGFFFALLVAASHGQDAAGCQRCLQLLCERSRFRWRPFQAYRHVAKRRGLCLRTLRPLLPRQHDSLQESSDGSAAIPQCKMGGDAGPDPARTWRQRRPQWNRLACQEGVAELLSQAEQEAVRQGGRLNAMDLAFVLRAARRNGTHPDLARALRLLAPMQQCADSVLLQEVLCALRRLRQPTAAWQVVASATAAGLRLNCLHYTTLLAMCSDHEDRDGVLRILQRMTDEDVQPDALFTATLARVQAGQPQSVRSSRCK